ncbi:tetratricopeptide repeat protein [candidate division KSB1 bacterium]|nr:tetratricopeptide repeat protein [candidate division KSB1 bacterium]
MKLTKKKLIFGFAALSSVLILSFSLKLHSNSKSAVTEEVLQIALSSHLPEKPVMTKSIEFFENRLNERNGEDILAQNQLLGNYLARFKAYGRQKDLAAAKKHLNSLLKRYPKKASLYSTLANVQMAEHQFEKAVESAKKAIEVAEGDDFVNFHLRLFDALLTYGDTDEARDILRTMSFSRRSFDFLVRKARLEDKLGNLENAKSDMEKALYQAKAYAQSPVVIGWCLVTLGHYEHHSGNGQKAVDTYLEALAQLPGYPAALEGIAAISHTIDHNLLAAKQLYQKALENGGELNIFVNLIAIERQLGNDGNAETYRNHFIKEATRDPQIERLYYRPLALLFAEKNETLSRALHYAKLDLKNRPGSESYDTLAWVLYKSGDIESAYDAATQAVAWGSPEPTVLYHSGIIMWDFGEKEKAQVLLKAALENGQELEAAVVADIRAKLEIS